MGQDQGRGDVKRIFWGCLIVLVDISIQGFDVLVDPVGYLIIASAAAGLVFYDPLFRAVRYAAYVLAIFSVGNIIRSLESQGTQASNVDSTTGDWYADFADFPGSPTTTLSEVSDLGIFLGLIGAAVGWLLVWSLLTGVSRIAKNDGLVKLSAVAGTAGKQVTGLLAATDLLGAGIAWTDSDPGILIVPVLLLGLATLLLGLWGLQVVRDASKRLLFVEPTQNPDTHQLSQYLQPFALVPALAAIASVVVAIS